MQLSRELRMCSECTFDVEARSLRCIIGGPPALASNHVGGIPAGPVVLGRRRLVHAVPLLCFLKQLCQCLDIEAESSSRQPCLDLLKNPRIAVGVGEGGV